MRLDHLLCLIEVSKTHSINKASEKLNISHQALSSCIKNLEDEFNTCLLHRNAQGVTLTETGQLMVDFATTCLTNLTKLKESIKQIEKAQNIDTPKGHISLATTAIPNHSFLQPTIRQFLLSYPQISIDISRASKSEIVSNVKQQKIMFGFTIIHQTPEEWFAPDCPFLFTPLLTDKSYIVVSNEHPLAKKKTAVTFNELLLYPLVVYREGNEITVSVVEKLIKNYSPQIQLTTDSPETFEEAILSEKAIGFTSRLLINSTTFHKKKEKLSFIRLKNTPTPITVMLLNKEAYALNTKIIDLFLDTLKSFTSPLQREKIGPRGTIQLI